MKVHPFCAVFPYFDSDRRLAMAAHIAQHGQQEEIWTYQGQIIDGKNRYDACSEAGQDPWLREWKPKSKTPGGIAEELYHFVVGANLRRDMDQSQRALLAGKLIDLAKEAGAKLTVEQAASHVAVSPRSVASARAILKEGNPEVIQAVENGAVKIGKLSSPKTKNGKKPAKNEHTVLEKTANLQSEPEDKTPFCDLLERCKWVDKHANPGIMELALDIQRQLGTRAGSFSANQIQVHITNIHNAFSPVVKIMIAARERYRKER